jgi:hypothetical protein
VAVAEEKAKTAVAVAEEKAKTAAAVAEEKAKTAAAVAEEKAKMNAQAHATESYLKLCLAAVQQRYYLEKFFMEVREVLKAHPKLSDQLGKPNPRMTTINTIVSQHWDVVKEGMSLPKELKWPERFQHGTLFGHLSDQVHQPGMTEILVGDKSPQDLMSFMEFLAKRYAVAVEQVDEEFAALGATYFN